jgi:endonuclease/exonuclease/phosphatase family metal-dependent hydrolase
MNRIPFRTRSTRRAFCFAIGVALAISLPGLLSAAEPTRVRVLSYNIHHGEGTDGKLDLERIARVITSVTPDIVALQEVDKKVTRTGGVDQPAELAKLTKLHVAFGGNIRFGGGDYGNAVLSRFEIAREKNHLLPSIDQGEQRGVLEVELKLPGEAPPLLFLNTHLDARRPDAERVASARSINELVAKVPKRPALLAGDLNDVAESETLKVFAGDWSKTNDAVLSTIPADRPRRQIDFVLYRPASAWRVVECRVLDEAVASDHRPILAVLELQPATD